MHLYANTNLILAHLISILCFCGGPVMSLLKEDLLHLAVLQVIQLSHGILGSLNKIHQHGIRTFTLQKCMLE